MKTIDSLGWGSTRASTLDVVSASPKPAAIPRHRWYWHYRALIKVREGLLKHRVELAAAIIEALENTGDTADAAADDFDHDFALSRLSAEQDVLYDIEAALARIRAGTYGRCEITGKPIPADRLRAIPWTRFCHEVEEQLEREGVVRPPQLGEMRSVEPVRSHPDTDEPDENEENLL